MTARWEAQDKALLIRWSEVRAGSAGDVDWLHQHGEQSGTAADTMIDLGRLSPFGAAKWYERLSSKIA